MTADLPEVLTDPVSVAVDIVHRTEPMLDKALVEKIVMGVAGRRAKRRRLAQALLDRPSVLIDGRSPAPRVVGDLLIALRAAGAVNTSPPVCSTCGKHLRTQQRRDQDWYCGVCGPRREQCTICGNDRPVSSRDRDGRPRCVRCEPHDDPVPVLLAVVAALDPNVNAGTIATALDAVSKRAGQRRRVAWIVQDQPELLTGAGADAPASSVLRLIDHLCQAGVSGVVQPPCPVCLRVVSLHRRIDGRWLCRYCVGKTRMIPCGRCGVRRQPCTRDSDGQPLCSSCVSREPANLEECTGCGRRRPVAARTPDGPFCDTCRPWPVLTCASCGQTRPCKISQATGQPCCKTCASRWARCTNCGQVRPQRGGTKDAPLCAPCTRPEPGYWRTCPTCGQAGRRHTNRCARCTLHKRLDLLLSDEHGHIRPELQPLRDALRATERPGTLATWLSNDTRAKILQDVSAGNPVTHDALDELPAGKTVDYLRAVLVVVGTLPERDEHMVRLERWIKESLSSRDAPEDQEQILRRYATWHVARRLRRRTEGHHITFNQFVTAREHVRAAMLFLDWLTARDLTLATCRQNHIDDWHADDATARHREAGQFLRWAKNQKLTTVEAPTSRWAGPTQALDSEARWEQARRLLHDQTLNTEDRVAGLLVLFYAQWTSAISRLTLDHITITDGQTALHLGAQPIVLPEPLASLMLDLVRGRRSHPVTGAATSRWLFPGELPGRPISGRQLGERLRRHGLRPRQARSTALFQLATDLPAAVLARMLGIHISSAAAWQRASAGDWTSYAADISRRTTKR
ncbi:hypothetical protein [Micromonospora globbae]|uniref:hypothetical protein n=1 Tax=Micromonospora globbae TaxID=1894969 RepID=UPI0037AEF2D9